MEKATEIFSRQQQSGTMNGGQTPPRRTVIKIVNMARYIFHEHSLLYTHTQRHSHASKAAHSINHLKPLNHILNFSYGGDVSFSNISSVRNMFDYSKSTHLIIHLMSFNLLFMCTQRTLDNSFHWARDIAGNGAHSTLFVGQAK